MSEEMKPCPFCGGDGLVCEDETTLGNSFYATCDNADCMCCVGEGYNRNGPDHCFATEQEAIAAWNKRCSTPVREHAEELRKLLSFAFWAIHSPVDCYNPSLLPKIEKLLNQIEQEEKEGVK